MVEIKDYREIFNQYPSKREYLIPVLQGIQDQEGYLSREGIRAVSHHLQLPESKIFGVATFYNQFKLIPPGKYIVQVCRGTACHVKGSFDLLETLKSELEIDDGETTTDRLFSIELVACIGACSIAPVITINGEFHGRLDKKKIVALIDQVKAENKEGENGNG